MSAKMRRYRPESDFLRIRDLLVSTAPDFPRLINWRVERWGYARCFVAPMIGSGREFCVTATDSERGIRAWEDTIAVWSDEDDEIIGVAHSEYAWRGQAWFERHPKHPELLPEMLDYAEAELVDPEKRTLGILVQTHDEQLRALLQSRGYAEDRSDSEWYSAYPIAEPPTPKLPTGYSVLSMADENDIERRRAVFGLAFNHRDPAEWPNTYAYAELQHAPGYRPDLDLFVVAPDGEYVSCCVVWLDEANRTATFEPVGTHPDYRWRGLGRAVVWSGIRRAAELGATTAIVGSGQEFYGAIGFRKETVGYMWTKRLPE
jgi:predicted N-acetyltransferase YhbS